MSTEAYLYAAIKKDAFEINLLPRKDVHIFFFKKASYKTPLKKKAARQLIQKLCKHIATPKSSNWLPLDRGMMIMLLSPLL